MKKMTDEEYNKLEGYRATQFKDIAKYGLFDTLNPMPRQESKAFEFGTLLHTLVLEREEVAKRYAQPLDRPKRSNADKEAHADYAEANKDKILVDAKDMQQAIEMSEVVLNRYGKIIERSLRELVFETSIDGIKLKAKIDIYDPKSGYIIDLKSTADDLQKVTQNSWDYGYSLQAGFYERVVIDSDLNYLNFGFLFSSKKDKRALMYECSQNFMEHGRAEFARVFDLVQRYENSQEIEDAVKVLNMPKWYMEKQA